MLQSRAQRPVKQKTTHTYASSNHETCWQDSTSWLSFPSGPAYWTFLSSPFSHRCIEPATAPRPSSPSATDVFTRPASPRHQLPICASDHLSSFKPVERASHPNICRATSPARGAGEPCEVQPLRDRNLPIGPTLHELPQPQTRGGDDDRTTFFTLGVQEDLLSASIPIATHQYVCLVSSTHCIGGLSQLSLDDAHSPSKLFLRAHAHSQHGPLYVSAAVTHLSQFDIQIKQRRKPARNHGGRASTTSALFAHMCGNPSDICRARR